MTTAGFQKVVDAAISGAKGADSLSYNDLVEETRKYFRTGVTKDLNWRKQQLRQIQKLITENHEKITAALIKDLGGDKFRGVFDMGCIADITYTLQNLDSWAADESVTNSAMLGKSYIRKEPKGVILVVAPWNFPFAMVFDPLVNVIAAGNCAIIKPSEVSENTCNVIAELVPKYMDNKAIKVVTGAVAETTALLREKFDHIMYTGNGAVARIVMQAAAKNLTPVTLELGGKSPVYVDSSARVQMAAQRISSFKWVNCGQICIAPDYVLVHEDLVDEFKSEVLNFVKKHFGDTSEKRQKNKSFPNIISARHVERIENLLKGTSGEVLCGGKSESSDRFFDSTVIFNPSLEDNLLKEEIFGPLLPIIPVKNVKDAIAKVNQICDEPLALYVFAENQNVINEFLAGTRSGGVCVNSVVEHISNIHLPFGGIGQSGLGKYHGKFGFDEFTHYRSVLVKDSMVSRGATIPLPPYSPKLYDLAIKFNVIGIFTETQKKLLKVAGVGAAMAAGYYVVKAKL